MFVNMFIFAVGLDEKKNVSECIVGAEVNYGISNFTWYEQHKKNFSTYVHKFMPVHLVVFGVLGETQYKYFKSLLECYKIVDISKCIPWYVDFYPPRNLEQVAFQMARIEMIQSILKPEEIICNNNFRDLDRMSIFVHAVGLKIFENQKFDSIMIAVYINSMVREFKDSTEFLEFVKDNKFAKYQNLGNVFGVLGDDQYQFLEHLTEAKFKIVNISNCIPKDINSICHNTHHARYHAKRIKYFNDVCLEQFLNAGTIYNGL